VKELDLNVNKLSVIFRCAQLGIVAGGHLRRQINITRWGNPEKAAAKDKTMMNAKLIVVHYPIVNIL